MSELDSLAAFRNERLINLSLAFIASYAWACVRGAVYLVWHHVLWRHVWYSTDPVEG